MFFRSRLAFVAAVALIAGHAVAAQPSQFRGGAEHAGVFAGPAPTLERVVWKFKTGGRVIASPVLSGDLVMVGSTDGALYAVDRVTGAQRWKFATKGAIAGAAGVSEGIAVVASVDGNIYGIDVATGTEKWQVTTGGERRFTAPGIHGAVPRTERMPDPFDVFLSSPTIANGIAYIGSGDQRVYAIEVKTGAVKWRFATGDVVHASPAVHDGVVFVGSWDRHLYAIDAATGRERWRYTTGNDTVAYNQVGIASSAAIIDGVVLVGGRDGKFHAVDERTGAVKWVHNNRGGWTIASPAVRDGVVYFPTSDGTRFKAIEIATGAVKFDLQNKAVSFSSPALVGDLALYGTSDGILNAVNVRTGALVATFLTDGHREQRARLIDENGRIRTRLLYPDNTLDGMMIGMRTMMTLGSVLSSPVVADGVVYFGSTDGQLYAVR